jgi:phenylalanine-4-hydroxylase
MESTETTPRGGYSPVDVGSDGSAQVRLEEGHPGFSDPVYRERRNAIAQLSIDYHHGDEIPKVEYTDQEHGVWRVVSAELAKRHEEYGCRPFVEAKEELQLPADHVPQLAEVSERLAPITGVSYEPVAGLAPLRDFYGSFASRTFMSTQYIRHPSHPTYTPEPDIIHEVIGHANQLADPSYAEIYVAVGDAVARTETHDALAFMSKVFWFTMEFGVVMEKGEPKAYGAGILSSVGELDVFRTATIKPLDIREAGSAEYDITKYQPVIYSLDSELELYETLFDFFGNFDDAKHRELVGPDRS